MIFIINNADFNQIKSISNSYVGSEMEQVITGDTNVTKLDAAGFTHADINDCIEYDGTNILNITHQRDTSTGDIMVDASGKPLVDTSVIVPTTVVT